MHYSKISPARVSVSKFTTALLDRRSYPAWIDAGTGVPFSAASSIVTARVRDSLVLRVVAKRHNRALSDVRGAH